MSVYCKLGVALALGVVFMFVGCFSTQVPLIYVPVKAEYRLTPHKRIAVISGTNDDVDITLAAKLTDKLIKSRAFEVIPQVELSKKIAKYPLNFNIVNREELNSKEDQTYLSEEVRRKANAIAASLHVDYLLIIWSFEGMSCSVGDYINVHLPIASRMIEYPSKDIVGYTHVWYANSRLGLLSSEPSEDQINTLYDTATQGVADKVLENANIVVVKPEKKERGRQW